MCVLQSDKHPSSIFARLDFLRVAPTTPPDSDTGDFSTVDISDKRIPIIYEQSELSDLVGLVNVELFADVNGGYLSGQVSEISAHFGVPITKPGHPGFPTARVEIELRPVLAPWMFT